MQPKLPSEAQVLGYFKKYSNWGRWGKDDQAGTLNLITPERRVHAARLVKKGITVSCGRPITTEMAPDVLTQTMHFITQSGEPFANAKSVPEQVQVAMDYLGVAVHGLTVTHLDSVGHMFWDGKMYNGFSAANITTKDGALVQSVEVAKDGIVGRGVLLDIPRVKDVKWIEPGESIYSQDMEAAERSARLKLEPGDVLLVRTGSLRRRNEVGPWDGVKGSRPGMHANCIPFLHDRGVAVLGTDTAADVHPSGYKAFRAPVHQVGIVAMGLWLIDNCDLEALAQTCERLNRWEFQFSLGPLRIQYGTGSPVNPLAVF